MCELDNECVDEAKATKGSQCNNGVDRQKGDEDGDQHDGGADEGQERHDDAVDYAVGFAGYSADDFAAVAGDVYGVGLVKGAAVDADAEVGACCKGETGAGPEKEKAHGAGQQGCNTERDGERQQELVGTCYACGMDEWLGCRELEYPIRGG